MKEKIKGTIELVNWLKARFNIDEIEPESLGKSFELCKVNAENCIYNTNKLSADSMEFIAYVIKEDDLSKDYYNDTRVSKLIVIFEKKTNFFQTDSNKLNLELAIERGISELDRLSNSDSYKFYLKCLDRLRNNEF